MQFFGELPSTLKDSTILISAISSGWIAQATFDVIIKNLRIPRIGIFEDDLIPPVICAFSGTGVISTALELFYHEQYRLTLLLQRSAPLPGRSSEFSVHLMDWIRSQNFSRVFVIAGCDLHQRLLTLKTDSPNISPSFLTLPTFPLGTLASHAQQNNWIPIESKDGLWDIPDGGGNAGALILAGNGEREEGIKRQLFLIGEGEERRASKERVKKERERAKQLKKEMREKIKKAEEKMSIEEKIKKLREKEEEKALDIKIEEGDEGDEGDEGRDYDYDDDDDEDENRPFFIPSGFEQPSLSSDTSSPSPSSPLSSPSTPHPPLPLCALFFPTIDSSTHTLSHSLSLAQTLSSLFDWKASHFLPLPEWSGEKIETAESDLYG